MVYNEYKRIYIDIYSKYMLHLQFTYPHIHGTLSHNPSLIHPSKYILNIPQYPRLIKNSG